uniref:Glycosyltransferase RgtA/B/C/D-like domain-containing protein n=1 Tax=Caldilinea aerophila TaxID=133453 RepID=A0A7C1JI74_9CHLR
MPRLNRSQLLTPALHGVALALVGLHLYVYTLPPTPDPIPAPDSAEAVWWGLWPVTYLPTWAVAVGAMAVVGAILLYWLPGLQDRLARQRFGRPPLRPILWLISAALLLAFFLFPIAHTRWGDAFILAKGIAFPDPALRLTRSWQAPLDVALHSELWRWLHEPLGWEDAAPVYRLLSPVAGALYLLVTLALCRLPLLQPAWLPYGLLTTLGLMQLFFGYVENYSFAAAGVLAYLWLGLAVIEGRRPLWLAATVLALTHAMHPSTIVLAPSLLYLGVLQQRTASAGGNQKPVSIVLQIALPMVLVGGATFLFMEASGHGLAALLGDDRPGGGDGRWFVPLFETTTRWEHYTMFSWAHFRDLLNNQVLVAPIVLPSLIGVGIAWAVKPREVHTRNRRPGSMHSSVSELPSPDRSFSSSLRFLLIAAAFQLLFITVWNPDYGGQRDWDLFSLAWLSPTLLLALLLPRVMDGRSLAGGIAPLLLLQAWHMIAWIYQNTLPWQWPR